MASEATDSSTQSPVTQSPLWKLPAELRLQIYRDAVWEDEVIVGDRGFVEPGLLLTCKAIRQEAVAVFYRNTFRVLIQDWDITDYVKFVKKLTDEDLKGPEFILQLVRGRIPNWSNVIDWLKKYHEGSVETGLMPPSMVRTRDDEYCVLGVMFLLARSLKSWPWSEVAALLEEQRYVLSNIDERWMD